MKHHTSPLAAVPASEGLRVGLADACLAMALVMMVLLGMLHGLAHMNVWAAMVVAHAGAMATGWLLLSRLK